jgi:large subunit ribosomal protein L13
MNTTNAKTTIDASGVALGRVASACAKALMGKDAATFERHMVTGGMVEVINASKMKIDARKLDTVTYQNYSGYPGGLREETLAQVIDKKGAGEALKRAIYGMLPANKLRARIMKNLSITE